MAQATLRATSAASAGTRIERTRSARMAISSRLETMENPHSPARRRVCSLRPSRQVMTSSPLSRRTLPTAAPISPGLRMATVFTAMVTPSITMKNEISVNTAPRLWRECFYRAALLAIGSERNKLRPCRLLGINPSLVECSALGVSCGAISHRRSLSGFKADILLNCFQLHD